MALSIQGRTMMMIQEIVFLELTPSIPLIQLTDFDSNRLSKLLVSNKYKLLSITMLRSIQKRLFVRVNPL